MPDAAKWNRLMNLGLRSAAESLKNEIRERHKRLGTPREDANEKAELEMWEAMKPAVEKAEAKINDLKTKLKEKLPPPPPPPEPPPPPPEPVFSGCPDDIAPFLDPNYSEKDPGNILRDGILWTAFQIRLVVSDSPNGDTSINLARASTPPPSPWALTVLEAFARRPPDKRGIELIARAMQFASKSHDPDQTSSQHNHPHDEYLDNL